MEMRSGSIMKGQTNDDRKKLIENALINDPFFSLS